VDRYIDKNFPEFVTHEWSDGTKFLTHLRGESAGKPADLCVQTFANIEWIKGLVGPAIEMMKMMKMAEPARRDGLGNMV
jgi:hypothetical protein